MAIFELSVMIQPWLLGKGIDGIMNSDYFYFALLALSYAICTLVAWKRMIYDTKVYTEIYNRIVLNYWEKQNVSHSAKVARSEMAQDIVSVLEGHVSYYIGTIITLLGSIWIIYITNSYVGIVVTTATVCVFFSAKWFLRRVQRSIQLRNNQYEKKIDAFSNSIVEVKNYLIRKRRLEILESTIQGANWTSASVIKNTFLILGIFVMVHTTTNITVGDAITLYSYMNNFLISLMSIPIAFEMISRLKDIFSRLYTTDNII